MPLFDAGERSPSSNQSLPVTPSIHAGAAVDVRPEEPIAEADSDCSAYRISAIVSNKAVLKACPLLPVVATAEGDPVTRLVSASKRQRNQMIDLKLVGRKLLPTPSAPMAILAKKQRAKRS
jgi:hypothetical protein